MNNSAKIFLVFLIIFIIIGGIFFFLHSKVNTNQSGTANVLTQDDFENSTSSDMTQETDKMNQIMAEAKAEEQPNPPAGYLTPNDVPSQFTLVSTRFTPTSTSYHYQLAVASSNSQIYLTFAETASKTFDQDMKTNTGEVPGVPESLQVVSNFIYNGSKGAVLGEFYNKNPDGSYYLDYDHQGRLVSINAIGKGLSPDTLIQLLKEMTPSK